MRSVLLSTFLLAASPALTQPTPEDQQLRDAAKTETYRDLTEVIADINDKRTGKPEPLAETEARAEGERKTAPEPAARPEAPAKPAHRPPPAPKPQPKP